MLVTARMGRDGARKKERAGEAKKCRSSWDVNAGLGSRKLYAGTKANESKPKYSEHLTSHWALKKYNIKNKIQSDFLQHVTQECCKRTPTRMSLIQSRDIFAPECPFQMK